MTKTICRTMIVGLVVCGAASLGAADRYVSPSGTNDAAHGYTRWSGAATCIQDAVNAAATGDTVWVSSGVYASAASNTPVVSITKGLSLRGLGGPSAGVILDGGGTHRGVMVNLSRPATVLIDGFTITNGHYEGAGAGIYLAHEGISSGTAVVQNCVISGNRAGNNPTNSQGTGGGGVFSCGQAGTAFHTVVSNCTFSGNRTLGFRYAPGGGASFNRTRLTLQQCRIAGNATDAGGTGGGGGVYVNQLAAGSVIRHCVIESNTAAGSSYGGGLNVNGDEGFGAGRHEGLRVEDCTIQDNSSAYGGGVALMGGATNILRRCQLLHNRCSTMGGGVWAGKSTNVFDDVAIISNTAPLSQGSYIEGYGAGVCVASGGRIDLWNSVVYDNRGRAYHNYYNHDGTLTWMYSCTRPAVPGWDPGNTIKRGKKRRLAPLIAALAAAQRRTAPSPSKEDREGTSPDTAPGNPAELQATLSKALRQTDTFFVGKTGSDGNDGYTKDTAFLTIQRGMDELEAGDTLRIGPGEYEESVYRADLGSTNQATTIRAELPGTVLLRGDVAVPAFRKVDGSRFIYVADFKATGDVVVVNELDTLTILTRMPNATELEFAPGTFHHDRMAGKLYLTTSDMAPPETHHYSASVIPTHGLYLARPRRVVIEGLAVTGFNAMEELNYRVGTGGGVWGMFLFNGKACVIRDCRAYLNAWGIGLTSAEAGSGDNVIERCTAWANASPYWAGDMGGLTIYSGRRDTIRDSTAFLNGMYGINIYGTGIGTEGGGGTGVYGDKDVVGNDANNRSRLVNNLAWGHHCDFKIKTGVDNFQQVERGIGPGLWSLAPSNILHGLIGRVGQTRLPDTIVLNAEKSLDPSSEFADPENRDYRLQATSRFRGAAPDGSDQGPHPYTTNVFYVAPAGSDGADGLSVEHAWKTLARAVKALRPGDTLYLSPGAYGPPPALSLQGAEGAPVSLRGRGREPVVIQGGLHLIDSRYAEFTRLQFSGPVTIGPRPSPPDPLPPRVLAFDNCLFKAAGTAVEATGVEGLVFRHCAFTGFQRAGVQFKGCARVWLSGNLYDNGQGAAVQMDGATTVQYSDYNSYGRAANAWEMAGRTVTLADLQADRGGALASPIDPRPSTLDPHDRYSQSLAPKFVQTGGVAALSNPGLFAAGGPFGRPAGPYRDESRQDVLKLIAEPTVHSLSPTTANLEWMTSLPATCELGWGRTPACTNQVIFDVNRFGSYSLTGLAPGQTYYFRIKSLRIPDDMAEKYGAEPVESRAAPLAFATPARPEARTVYQVAPDGDDRRTGLSRQQAWRTIQHAADQVKPGDTVLIAGGTYRERVRIRATGDTGAPITFTCAPGEKVMMNGAGKALSSGFIVAGKKHLRFDGLYFADFSLAPADGWLVRQAGEFNIYDGDDVAISRCFFDGRGGYTARPITAWKARNLTIRNCISLGKFDGMAFTRCPNLRVENCVFTGPMIMAFIHRNTAVQEAAMDHNIFTDMYEKKAHLNINLFAVDGWIDAFRMRNNCILVRCFPPDKRALIGDRTIGQLGKTIVDTLFADPQFAGDPGVIGEPANKTGFAPDRLTDPSMKLDFDSFFATNPEVVRRRMGLQREAFKDFQFDRRDTQEK